MLLPTTVKRLRESNTPGACKLQLIPVESVLADPVEVNGTVPAALSLAEGATTYTIESKWATQHFKETHTDQNGSPVAMATVALVISKDRAQLLGALWELRQGRYVCLNWDKNGTLKLLGTLTQPALVQLRMVDHGARPGADANLYEVLVTVTRETPAPFYLATPPTPGVPAGCPTLGDMILAPGGEAAAIEALGDGSTFYGFLAAMLSDAAATTEAIVVAMDGAGVTAAVQGAICPVVTLCSLIDEAFLAAGDPGITLTVGANTDFVPETGAISGRPSGYLVNFAGTGLDAEYYWLGFAWVITDGASAWSSTEDVATVDLVTAWTLNSGPAGTPVVTAAPGGGAAAVLDCLSPEQEAEMLAALGGTGADATAVLKDTAGATLSTTPIPAGTSSDITAPDATANLKDSAGNAIGSSTIRSGGSALITAPDGSVQQKNSAGTNIGSAVPVRSNETGVVVTAPDATVKTTDGATTVQAIPANTSGNLPQSRIKYKDAANASQVTAAADTEYASSTLRPATEVPRREMKNAGGTGMGVYVTVDRLIADTVPNAPVPLKFAWAAGNADSLTWTVTSDEAGTYTTYSTDGSSGTLTYSKNGGAYAAISGTITLAVADTITVRRTVTTAAGFTKWVP